MYKTKYRVKVQTTYDLGCPIIYSVQMSQDGFWGEKWINLKNFDQKHRAEEFLKGLK